MADIIETFETTAGTVYHKKEDTAGRTYHHKEGEGRISGKSFGAGKSHRAVSEAKRGHDVDADDLGHPYDQAAEGKGYLPTEAMPEGDAREKAGAKNAFVGFLESEGTPDDVVEAAQEYDDMLAELKEKKSQADQEEVREKYGVGGS